MPTVGVEEEFLLIDPESGINMPVAAQVIDRLPGGIRPQSRLEFRRSMVEMVTPVCADVEQLGRELTRLRTAAGAAAATAGAQLVAVAATPIGDPQRDVPDVDRYRAMQTQYGAIAGDPAVCGCHVHVGVPDRETAVQVCNHLRPWLPVIQAMTANSPLHAGADTGHASWRSVALTRWPSLGPGPYLSTVEDYERAVERLLDAGTILDESMVYWYARPSVTYPTVEVRVSDVTATVADATLLAALVRGLVATAIADVAAGLPAPRVDEGALSAAHWCAARHGLQHTLLDWRLERPRPAWAVVGDMVSAIAVALEDHGDLRTVNAGLDRLRRLGTGAERQRRIYRRGGDVREVVSYLAEQTVLGCPAA